MLLHLLRLRCVEEKNVHLNKTTDRFKTNFHCKTAFTTTRVYIEKLFKFKAFSEQIPMMKCVLWIKLVNGTGTRNELSG